jgi:DNA (cytosine-5)-methyltransferase 1
MPKYTCSFCTKIFTQQQYLTNHQRTNKCLGNLKPLEGLRFIDLFCGIGGFHLALSELGAKCVLACDIDKKCREVYEANFKMEPKEDIKEVKSEDIPAFDILCGGFPCQAFSHAGNQGGFEDTRGTLFREICRILRDCKPKYFLLENVKNLKGHDDGKTIKVIYENLRAAGYTTHESPIVLSPHMLGIPQNRERVFLLGIRNDSVDGKKIQSFPSLPHVETDIGTILEDESIQYPTLKLNSAEEAVITAWNRFVLYFKDKKVKLPTFPLWTEFWGTTNSISSLPDWKQKFIESNRTFYKAHESFLKDWLETTRTLDGFTGAKTKFEWQCGEFQESDSLFSLLFTFRPSGIRVKRRNYSPTLVAMAQIVYIGERKRKLSPREVARLQSYPDSFKIHPSQNVAFKQFGNSVNVAVIKRMAEFLIKEMLV